MSQSPLTQNDFAAIMDILQCYFDGLYEGDTDKLRAIFHQDTVLKANGVRRNRDEWLKAVTNRRIPKDEEEPYRFKVVSLEIINDQALAKVEAPLFENHFVDYLGLLKENDQWLIVNKTYTTV